MQTAIVLLLIEMDRKAKEDAEKKTKSVSEAARINELHEGHLKAEKEMRREQQEINDMLGRMDERLMMLEEQILDIRKDQNKRRWGIF